MRKTMIVLVAFMALTGCGVTPTQLKSAPNASSKTIISEMTYQEAYRRIKGYLEEKYESGYTQIDVDGDLYSDTKTGAIKVSYKAAGICVMTVDIAEKGHGSSTTIFYTSTFGIQKEAEKIASTLFPGVQVVTQPASPQT